MWKYNQTTNSDELYHYGVLGMKWGKRKVRTTLGNLKGKRTTPDTRFLIGGKPRGERPKGTDTRLLIGKPKSVKGKRTTPDTRLLIGGKPRGERPKGTDTRLLIGKPKDKPNKKSR